jgi:uncharacterized glyoxalase superfamily protein PhnB
MIRKMTVNMMVADVQKTIAFYQSQLEFSFAMGVTAQGNEVLNANDPDRELVYAMMTSGAVEIMFQQTASLAADIPAFAGKSAGASVSFYCDTDDVEALYAKLRSTTTVVKELHTTWYGMREFYITDCNGYVLGFAQQQA